MYYMIPLTSDELTLIGYIEQQWHSTGKFPRAELLLEKFGLDVKDLIREHEVFKRALINRGIKFPNYDLADFELDGITNEQVAAIITILNFEDRRPRSTKLKEMGITTTQWNGWMKQPEFVAYLHDLSTKNFASALDKAHEGLLKNVERGDVNGIKLYLELTGKYTPGSGPGGATGENVRILLQRLIEVIQIHVKDPLILRAIGEDFEKVMSGQPVETRKQINV